MKKFIALSAIVTALSLPVSALTGDGTWYKPSNSDVFHSIEKAIGAGNHIWFMTENGVGRLNTATGERLFFSFGSIGTTEYFHRLVVGDSAHVALVSDNDFWGDGYTYARSRITVFLYDGASWRKTTSPYSHFSFSMQLDSRGHFWILDDERLVKYDGREWKTLLDKSESAVFPGSSPMVDDTGLWICHKDTIADSIRILRLENSQLRLMASIDGSYAQYARIFRDISGTTWIFHYEIGLYKLGSDRTLTHYPKSYDMRFVPTPKSSGFDWGNFVTGPDGTLWSICPDGNNLGLGRAYLSTATLGSATSLDSVEIRKVDTISTSSNAVACYNGVYVCEEGRNDFRRYTESGPDHSTLSMESWGDACGNFGWETDLLFKKDSSIVSADYYYNYLKLFSYKNGKCRELPQFNNTGSLCEHPDGTLLIYGSSMPGVFTLRESAWELLPGTGEFRFLKMMVDSRGKIWGTAWGTAEEGVDGKIVHQTDFGWELIDSANSNFPFNFSDVYLEYFEYLPPFIESADGSIWAQIGKTVAATRDGYHWTVFDADSLGIPSGRIRQMYKDGRGNIAVICGADCDNLTDDDPFNDTCAKAGIAVYNGNDWKIEAVSLPKPNAFTNSLYRDGKGDLWMWDNDYADTARYVFYRSTDSAWIRYDSTVIPYSLVDIIGEDAAGKLYFRDKYQETVVFDRNGSGVSPFRKHTPSKSTPLRCRVLSGSISVDYTLSQPGEATLSLYTLQGRLVKTITAERQTEGMHHDIFSVNCAPGIYFVRLIAPGGSQGAKIMLR